MPKVGKEKSPSVNRSSQNYPYWGGCGRYPYPYPPVDFELPIPRFASAEETKEWDEVRCPICMESPHNTVLLKCSSYEKGCRPYMCNTSSRHSNCLDQFCKSFDSNLSSAKLEEIPLASTASKSGPGNSSQRGNQLQPKVTCPLCRGGVYGYMVSETARRYLNSKIRSCSSETCEFQGTYPELRKHARLEHPSVRPTEVDPSRQDDWVSMQEQREVDDILSSLNERYGDEHSGEHTILSGGLADLISLITSDVLTFDEGASLLSSLWSDPRPRMRLHNRISETVHMVSNVTQTNQSARWRSSLPSTHRQERIHRAGSRINPSSSHDLEANSTARWRENTLPPDMAHSEIFYNYYMEPVSTEVRTSSTRMPRVSQYSQPNPSTSLSSTHQQERIHRARSRINPSSSHDLEANSTARWRENTLPPGMAHSEIVYNYYMEPVNTDVRTSSTRMPRVSQYSQFNPSTNNSSSRRNPGRRLRWRHQ